MYNSVVLNYFTKYLESVGKDFLMKVSLLFC